jgi:hypothetical protein
MMLKEAMGTIALLQRECTAPRPAKVHYSFMRYLFWVTTDRKTAT